MKLAARLAILLAAIAPVAAQGDASPSVVLATPGVGNGAIERFTMRFSAAMVPLGDPRAAPPAKTECSGEGRWVDQSTWVYEFSGPLAGGTTCKFDLVEGLKSTGGYAVSGTRNFTVDAGGPIARAVLPSAYGSQIEEDQVFLVAANMAPDRASVGTGAYCAVDGLGEKIPVDVLDAALPGKLLSELSTDRWEVRSFLENAGLPSTLPANAQDRATTLGAVVAVKCRRPLPPGRDMALVWAAGITGGGKPVGTDQRFDYSVRKPFTARFECSRVNPQAGCNPVQEAWVRFTAPIPRDQASAVRLTLSDGKQLSPTFQDDDKSKAMVSDLKFASPLPEAMTAKLEIPAGIKDESGRPLSNAERFPLDVRFDRAPPLVKFAAPFGILELGEGGVLPVTVRAVEPQLAGRVAAVNGQSLRVDASDGEIAAWLRTIDSADDWDVDEKEVNGQTIRTNNTGSKPILPPSKGAALNVALPGKGKDFEVVGIPLKRAGFYVVEMASPVLGEALLGRKAPRYVAAGALVTNMSVHFKWGREGSLAWVTSLDSGKPVAGADVRVTDSCTGKLLVRGKSDAQGRLSIKRGLPEPETYGRCEDAGETPGAHPLMISARAGDDFSFDLTSWGEGIRPFDFDLPYGWSAKEEIVHTVFDRALVRQGETINMKHIVRRPVAEGFRIDPGFTGTLTLSHRGSDTQFELPLTIDANGTGETTWTAPRGAPMGDYDLRITTGSGDKAKTIYTSQSFKLDEYKLPTMKASVSGPKEAAVRPKTMPLDLFVGYLSGGGAANLPVDLRVAWFARGKTPAGYDNFTFGGDAIQEGVKPMNGNGEEEITPLPPTQSLPFTLTGDGSGRTTVEVPQLTGNTDMLVEMDYQDANGEVLTASRSIPVFGSAVQLGARTDGWMMKQDDLRLKLVALDTNGKPVSGQRVNVELYSREILTARRRLIGGFYAYDNRMKTTKLSDSCSATTDKLGLAECKLDPDVSGEVYAVATTTDSDGNVSRAVKSVWLAGDDDWWFGGDNGDRMDLIPEHLEYASGAKARFQVRMPFRSATALVTVEREGVLSSFVTELSGTDPVVEVPLAGNYAPDVYVSVMAVRGRIGGFKLWLANLARDWGLPFFSREGARPTALVDLAKPSYRMGMARVKVGWEDHRLNVAVNADKERYAARETAQVEVQVHAGDKPAAQADVTFVAVDEALLQLAPNDSWKLLDAMMGERSSEVLTSTAQTQVVGKRHYGRKTAEPGGGGGGDLSGLNRENFQPVLLWRGRVALDSQGRARIPVKLNDALSSFRLVAIASSGAQYFGTGEASIRTAQDLSIFAGLPPLVRTGDWYAGNFTLRNGSDKPMTVTAEVQLTPAIARGKPLTVTIPAGGAAPIAWNLTAPATPGNLSWKVSARSSDGRAIDMMTVAQEVAPAVPIETWAATLARVGDDTAIPIQPPAGFLAGRGSVDIALADTLAPPLDGVRQYMGAYPYICFEQRLSKAVALGDTAAWNVLAGEMPTYVDGDGLLRYFPSDTLPGSEALTAYVLSLTAEVGLPVPEGPRGRMVEALKAVLDGRLRREDYGDIRLRKVAAFSALARVGAATPAMLGQLGMTPNEMPTSTLADYITALGKVEGLANGPALRSQAEGVLRTRLVYEGTRLDLSDASTAAWWMMSSGDESAIKAVLAVLGRPGWQDDAPRMMAGVALRQSRGHWDTTTANAWGTVAAKRFGTMYPAEAIAGITTASLGTSSARASWPLAPERRLLSLPLPSAPTPLRLSQAGGAGPWALVSIKAAVPLTRPLNAGYKMTKAVEVVQARHKGQLTRGDVIKVTITVDASAERNWVVVSDPVPAGATIVGGMANQSTLLGNLAGGGEGVSPSYIERGKDAWRAYFAWVPPGQFTVSYVMRLNGAGRLQLPPTRVEALYSPAIRAQLPNQPVVVAQR